jgi:hypothetical protein
MLLSIVLLCSLSAIALAQTKRVVFMSAFGNDANDGLSGKQNILVLFMLTLAR